MIFCHHLTVCHNFFYFKVLKILYKKDVCNSSRTDGADFIINAVCFCTIDGCHLDCCHWLNTSFDCQTYHVIKMTFFQHICRCHIIGTEADATCECRIYLCHCFDIFLKEMCHRRFTDQHMHSFSHLLYHFLVVITFMVQTHSAAQIAVQIISSCHWRTSKYRKTILISLCNCSQRIFILFLQELSYRLPNTVAFRPLLNFCMNFLRKVKCNC